MFFNEIEIENYKCFRDKVTLKLEQGINVIIGKNNVGKTALLEALSLQFPDKPHYSIETFPREDLEPQTHSKVAITFTLEIDEIKRILLISKGRGNNDFRLPLDLDFKLPDKENDKFDQTFQDAAGRTHGSKFFSNKTFVLKLQREGYDERGGNWYVPDDCYVFPKIRRAEENDGNTQQYVDFQIEREDRNFDFKKTTYVSGGGKKHRDDFTGHIIHQICRLADKFGQYIYKFQAERVPLGICSLEENRKLETDSSNLAEVLHYYLSNLNQANKFNKLVRQIIPNIYQVAAPSFIENGKAQAKIVVWNTKKASERDYLSLPLKDVGSGVSQILAIIYVLLTAKEPQIILIDEPQGFLHPDAARKLIEVLRDYGNKHQIIVATHSPTIITSAEPKTVTLIKQKSSRSVLQKMDVEKVDSQRVYLSEIGAKLSDVFGYDRVIWVEGITEEICFPKILRKIKNKSLLGTAILEVHSVGEFRQVNKKDINRIVHIYKKLSSGDGGLVPEAVGFIFDRDDYSKEQIEKWREENPELHFTKRRTYENYLLNSQAIAFVINKLEGKSIVKPTDIETWFEKSKIKPKYYTPLLVPDDLNNWTQTIHGKRLLAALFKEFCTTQYNQNFKERVHSKMLTDWLLKNLTIELSGIAELIEEVIKV
jgi:predicted ATP-dependent endonuclease of OLD family